MSIEDLGLFPDNPLEQARLMVVKKRKEPKGCKCPTCGQFAKEYKRSITSSMAYALILIVRETERNGDKFFHVEDYLKKLPNIPSSVRGDFAKLQYWDMIAKEKGKRPDGSDRTGMYRATVYGRMFAKGQVDAFKYLAFYNNKCLGNVGQKRITIREAVKDKFDYNELMTK